MCPIILRALCAVAAAVLALDGLETAPGAQRRCPCDGNPELTFDLYLPKAYDGKAKLPVVFLSSPGGNPGFMGLEGWAETNGTVLVTVNDSRNGPSDPIIKAQEAILATIAKHLTLHAQLRFSCGMSGAAQASWLLASRYPNAFAGVVMMGQAGFSESPLARHINIFFICGDQDQNRGAVEGMYRTVKSAGNRSKLLIKPGGHVAGSTQEIAAALGWMLDYQRLKHPLIPPAEQHATMKALLEELTTPGDKPDWKLRAERLSAWLDLFLEIDPKAVVKIAPAFCQALGERAKTIEDPGERADALAGAVNRTALHGCKEREPLISAYIEARDQQLTKTENKALRMWLLHELLQHPELKKAPRRSEYTKDLASLKKEASLKSELAACVNYWALYQMIQTNNEAQLIKAAKFRDQLVQQLSDTIAAKKAKELAIPTP